MVCYSYTANNSISYSDALNDFMMHTLRDRDRQSERWGAIGLEANMHTAVEVKAEKAKRYNSQTETIINAKHMLNSLEYYPKTNVQWNVLPLPLPLSLEHIQHSLLYYVSWNNSIMFPKTLRSIITIDEIESKCLWSIKRLQPFLSRTIILMATLECQHWWQPFYP